MASSKYQARSKSQGKGKGKGKGKTASRAFVLEKFHKFPELPAELRLMIIERALNEDEKHCFSKVILYDHQTYRVSPLLELSQEPSPILFVDTQFREAALKIYVALDVLNIGDQFAYGKPEDWQATEGITEYSSDVAKMIDSEADAKSNEMAATAEADQGNVLLKHRIYIRPKTDIFLTGSIPRQVYMCPLFNALLQGFGKGRRWTAPVFHVSERLPLSARANISIMRKLVWDPVPKCVSCGDYYAYRCPSCFLADQGSVLLEDTHYDVAEYPNVKEFGIYVMGGDYNPETIMYDFVNSKRSGEDILIDMMERYIVMSKACHEDC